MHTYIADRYEVIEFKVKKKIMTMIYNTLIENFCYILYTGVREMSNVTVSFFIRTGYSTRLISVSVSLNLPCSPKALKSM